MDYKILRDVEDDFNKAVSSGQNAELILERMGPALKHIKSAMNGAPTASDAAIVHGVLNRIKATSDGIGRFEAASALLVSDSRKQLRQSLAAYGATAFKSAVLSTDRATTDASTSGRNSEALSEYELTLPYRMWFLNNFAWPYPESSERVRLLAQVRSHGRAQLSNWFVNSRRRSGWSRFAKKYTDGDRDALAAFLCKIESGNATEEEVEDVEKCKAHFMDKGNMLVRDGIEEVLTAASMGALTDGCVPPSKMALSRIFPIKSEDPRKPVLSKKRGRIEDVEDPPSSPCSKRSTSGSWTDSSGVLSNDTGETSVGSNSDLTTPRRKSARVPRSPAAKPLRPTTKPAPSTPAHQAPVTLSRLPQTPHLRSFSSPLSSPTVGRFTRSGSTYRAVSSSFTIEQPNLAGELALPPPPFQITSNEHFVTLATTKTWSNLDPWLNFVVDLNAI